MLSLRMLSSRFEFVVGHDRSGFWGGGKVPGGATHSKVAVGRRRLLRTGTPNRLHRPTRECLWVLKSSPEKSKC
jgi:hypothetical protein